MEYGSITATVDIFEVLLVAVLLPGFLAAAYNVREAWGEKEWALDDPSPSMRRLGVNRYDNARLLFLALCLIAVGTLSALLVPSAIQIAAGDTAGFSDVLNAVVQRVVFIGVVLCITYKCVNDAVWRRDIDRRRAEERAEGAAAGIGAPPGVPAVEAQRLVIEGKEEQQP